MEVGAAARTSGDDPVVGVIGLGVMGKPMARRLVEAGYDVVVHSRTRAPVEELVALGAVGAEGPEDVACRCDLVITVLPDTPDIEEVVLGPGGVFGSLRAGGLVIDMSTIAPATARRIAVEGAARKIDVVDAPVSGGQQGAEQGTLAIMCGGEAGAVERARPILAHLGSRIVHVGPAGSGQLVKACNQIVVGITLQAMAEALCLGVKAGIDPGVVVEALSGGAARCWALDVRAPRVLERDFSPGFRVRLHHKDLRLALAAGRELGVTLPLTATVHELLGALRSLGREDLDHSALITLVEDLSGCRVEARSGGAVNVAEHVVSV